VATECELPEVVQDEFVALDLYYLPLPDSISPLGPAGIGHES